MRVVQSRCSSVAFNPPRSGHAGYAGSPRYLLKGYAGSFSVGAGLSMAVDEANMSTSREVSQE